MTPFTDRTAPRPFLFARRHFLTPELLRRALAFSGRRTRTRVLPAPFVLLVLVAGFLQGRLGLPRILAWLGSGGDLTVLLDPAEAPAREVADVYARRWEVEGAFAEFKGRLAGRTTHVRSRTVRAVMAELDALLIGYFVVRRVSREAARRGKVDPLSVSFRRVVQTVIGAMARPTSGAAMYREAARGRNRRRTRSCPRCRKVVRCAWPVKKPCDLTIRYETATLTIESPSP